MIFEKLKILKLLIAFNNELYSIGYKIITYCIKIVYTSRLKLVDKI